MPFPVVIVATVMRAVVAATVMGVVSVIVMGVAAFRGWVLAGEA